MTPARHASSYRSSPRSPRSYVFGYWIAQQNARPTCGSTPRRSTSGSRRPGLNILTGYNGQVSIGHGAFFGLGAYTTRDPRGRSRLERSCRRFPVVDGAVLRRRRAHRVPRPARQGPLPRAGHARPRGRVPRSHRPVRERHRRHEPRDAARRARSQFPTGTSGSPTRSRTSSTSGSARPTSGRTTSRSSSGCCSSLGVFFMARGRFGRALIAVRDHEAAAETVGINLAQVKVTAFALSALYAGTAGSLSVLVTRLGEREQGRDVPAVDRVPGRGRDRRRGDGHRPDARRVHRRLPAGPDRQQRSPQRPVLRPEPREAALAGDLRDRPDHLDVRPARRDRRRRTARDPAPHPSATSRRPRRWRPDERNMHATPTREALPAGPARRRRPARSCSPPAAAGATTTTTAGQRQRHDRRRRRYVRRAFEIDTANCLTDPSSVAITGDTIKFGTTLPQSGTYAAFSSILKGEQAYIDVPQRREGRRRDRRQEVQDRTRRQGRRVRRRETTFANVQSLVDDDDVFGLFNVVGTKNNLAIRDYVNENCVPNLLAATGSPRVGQPRLPVAARHVPRAVPARDAGVRRLPEGQQARRDDRHPARRRRLRRRVLGDAEGADRRAPTSRSRGEQTYDPETGEVGTQVTSLAATNADVFVLGATLLACPTALDRGRVVRLEADHLHVGDVHVEDADEHRGTGRRRRVECLAADGPERPAYVDNAAMKLYKEKLPKYARPTPTSGNGIVAYGWTAAASLEDALSKVEEPNRLGVMQTARTLTRRRPMSGSSCPTRTGRSAPTTGSSARTFDLVQYSIADGFFKPIGDCIDARRRDRGDHARQPDQRLIKRLRSSRSRQGLGVGHDLEALRVAQPVEVAAVQLVVAVEAVEVHDDAAKPASAPTLSRTTLIVPEPGVGDEHHELPARTRAARSTVSPSVASGERTPPAPLDEHEAGVGAAAVSAARSAIVNGGRSSSVGGHRRRHRHREPAVRRAHGFRGPRRVAAAEHVGVGRSASSGSKDCAGLRAPHADAAAAQRSRATRAVTHVLPTSVPVPVTTTITRRAHRERAEHARERGGETVDLLVGVRGRQRDAQPGRAGRDRRRPDRGHEQAALEQRDARRERTRSVAAHERARSAKGGRAAAGRRGRAAARRARRLRATARSAARRARPRCRRGSARS